MALVGISAATSLTIGLVLYYFAENRLVNAETSLLEQRSRTANAGARDFLEGLRNPETQDLPPADTYAEELVRSVADPTGLGVLYLGRDGRPLAARDGQGESVSPEVAYDRFGLNEAIVEGALEASRNEGRLVPTNGQPRYIAVWPLTTAGGTVRGVMVYNSPPDELDQTLSYLRYGIIGAIGASVLLAGLASLLLAREITRPLSATRDAAIRVASGDYHPVSVEREDELGEVARAFNYMAGEVEHYVNEIQEQKSRLEAVLEASPEAVVATDPEERVTMANPAAAQMLEIYTIDYGRSLEDLEVPQEILRCVREAAAEGVAVREVEWNGKILWTYAARMKNRGNRESPGIILAVRDITEHRSLERARTAFVSDVSHELRTPLTTIQSAIGLLERGREKLDPLEHRALELADQELKRIRGMVEELLTLAQMDSWQYSLEIGPASLSGIIQNAVDGVQAKAERFGINVYFDDDGIDHQCTCDAQRLYQVILNLLDNAIKYSDPGARVDVSLEERDSFFCLEIRDTGMGIPEEDLPQLFERFYRVNKDRSRSTGGSGLGLAIAKQIIEMHGGEISVESQVGVGSTFVIKLPKAAITRASNYAI